ncbi:hypothetical protein D3C85_1088750 [compost metagenome]
MLYREDRGWGFGDGQSPKSHIVHLEQQVAELQQRIARIEGATGLPPTPTQINSNEGV